MRLRRQNGLPLAETLANQSLDLTPADRMLAAGGVALACADDAARAYPGLWRTRSAARKAMERAEVADKPLWEILNREMSATSLRVARYQVAGPGRKPNFALIDPDLVPDPAAWLADRLGPLATFELLEEVPVEQPETSCFEAAPAAEASPAACSCSTCSARSRSSSAP
jgi:hypothetical protein